MSTRTFLTRVGGMAFAALLVMSGTAAAQGTSTTSGTDMRTWDAAGTTGAYFLRLTLTNGDREFFNWIQRMELGGQAGHYLTPHLKVELAVRGLLDDSEFLGDEQQQRKVSFAPAVTWQFFGNRYMHPYLNGGIGLDVIRIDRFGYSGARSLPAPDVDPSATVVSARPFLAAGTKTYFNDRSFIRTEAELGMARSRTLQVSLRAGIGVDF